MARKRAAEAEYMFVKLREVKHKKIKMKSWNTKCWWQYYCCVCICADCCLLLFLLLLTMMVVGWWFGWWCITVNNILMDKYDFWKYNFCPFIKIVVIVILNVDEDDDYYFLLISVFVNHLLCLVFLAVCLWFFPIYFFLETFGLDFLRGAKIKSLWKSWLFCFVFCDMNATENQTHSIGGKFSAWFFVDYFWKCFSFSFNHQFFFELRDFVLCYF